MPKQEQHGVEDESLLDPELSGVISFVKEHRMSPAEMFASYRIAMGIEFIDSEKVVAVREEVYSLAKLMGDLMNGGFPMNVLVGLLESRHDFAHAIEKYNKLVDELDVDFRGGAILKKILSEARGGTLSILEPGGKKILLKATVSDAERLPGADNVNSLAMILEDRLKNFKGQKIEVEFIPD